MKEPVSGSALGLRLAAATEIATEAALLALRHFRRIDELIIESKGHQDLVSNADKEVERLIRQALLAHFPEDAVIGEEYEAVKGSSGYLWVIDPIDGTANFVTGTPGWAVVLACVYGQETVIGVIRDPVSDETWRAVKGGGAELNARPLQVSTATDLSGGSTGVGLSNRRPVAMTRQALDAILDAGGIFYRNGSGALMLAYVAAGRLIGYCEPHMNAWDCLAALLLIEEAGGRVEVFDPAVMLERGETVVAAAPGVYQQLLLITQAAYRL